MYNLLRFIKINQFLLLFLLIEGFSVFLLLKNNSYQANTKFNEVNFNNTNYKRNKDEDIIDVEVIDTKSINK